MALKPVFQIDIDDTRFKSFKNLFDRYKREVEKLPPQWAKLNEGIGETKTLMEKLTELAEGQAALAERREAAENKTSNTSSFTAVAWSNITTQVVTVNRNITDATKSLIKWSTVTTAVAGLLGVKSLFGLDRLANSVAAQRRQAMGLGTTYGQRAAFETNYSRLISNPTSLLSGANQAKYDYTSGAYNAFLNAGVSPDFIRSHNSADISRNFLDKLDQAFADIKGKGNEGEIGARAKAMRLDETGMSLNDIVAYLSASGREKEELARKYADDSKKMGVSEEAQKKWADLVTQLERAGKQIEGVFMTKIAALAPAIEKLSTSLEEAAIKLAESETFKKWVDAVGEKIEDFAKFLKSPEFEEAEKGFVVLIEKAASTLSSFVAWVSKYAPEIAGPGEGEPGSWNSGKSPWTTPGDSPENLPGAPPGVRGGREGNSSPVGGLGGASGRYPRFPHSTTPSGGPMGSERASGHAFYGSPMVSRGPAPVGSVDAKARWLMDRMKADFNLTDAQAAGAVGWMLYESGGALNPGAHGPGGDTGWAQWVGSRKAGLLSLGPPTDETNYQWMKWELEHTHKYALDHLRQAQDDESALWIWGHDYEGAGGTPLGMNEEYRRHKGYSLGHMRRWQSTGRTPSVRIRGNTGSNPFVSNYGTAHPTAPP